MGRWRNGWWAAMQAALNDEISWDQLHVLARRHQEMPQTEETLNLLLSSLNVAKDDHARAKAAAAANPDPPQSTEVSHV